MLMYFIVFFGLNLINLSLQLTGIHIILYLCSKLSLGQIKKAFFLMIV